MRERPWGHLSPAFESTASREEGSICSTCRLLSMNLLSLDAEVATICC
jgi:hypothetical protein